MQERKMVVESTPARDASKHSAGSRRQIEIQVDLTPTVRCPLCRHPLVAMVGASGPFFFCDCIARKRSTR